MPANQPLNAVSASPLSEGEILAEKYRIERVLGVGGMGVVVAAWHLELDQRVAIKFLHQDADRRFEAAKRFRREARAAAKIRSEHAARVFDVGTLADQTPYIVMEYLEGNTLAQEVRIRGPLPVVEAVDYILQAIDALAEVHALGIVHRDLKPANLFLALRPDGTRSIKLLDFGISKPAPADAREDVGLTRAELLIGSPQYMSPEQLTSATEVDSRADIWSLGAILYKMLTRRPPYTGASVPQIYAALLRDAPGPLSQFRNDVPAELEAVILHCLEKEREGRFTSVGELAYALLDFCSSEARVYADRACRVLSVTSVTPISSTSLSMRPATSQVRSIEPARAAALPPWTRRLTTEFERLGSWRWAVLGAACVLLATIALVLIDPWAATSTPSVQATSIPRPASVRARVALPDKAPERGPELAVAAPPIASVKAEVPLPAAAPKSAVKTRPRNALPVQRARAKQATPVLDKPEKKSEKASDVPISDFGGRR